jgi:hypothetical protein
LPQFDKEAQMAVARVVEFEGVSAERMAQMQSEMENEAPPEGFPSSEFVVLHDAASERAVVIFTFDNEDDYAKADEILNAMPADETPGRRASVTRYDVVTRQSM